MRVILALLAALLAAGGIAALALGVAVFADSFPMSDLTRDLNQPGRAAEIFTGGLSMLGLGAAAGFGSALLGRIDRLARVIEESTQARRLS